MQWLYNNLKEWTPFSVLVLVAGVACAFIIVWDTIYGLPYPVAIVSILSVLLAGSGTTTLINHGVKVANGVAADTAAAVVQAANTAPVPAVKIAPVPAPPEPPVKGA